MIVAYVRVSSRAQDAKSQRSAIERAAAARDDVIDGWYSEKRSGKSIARPNWIVSGHLIAATLGHEDERTTMTAYAAPGAADTGVRRRGLVVLNGGRSSTSG